MSKPRYFVSLYTDGPATRWNVIDSQTQEWVRRFATEKEALDYAYSQDVAASSYADLSDSATTFNPEEQFEKDKGI